MKRCFLIMVLVMAAIIVFSACGSQNGVFSASDSEMIAGAHRYIERNFDADHYNVRILEQSRDQCAAEITVVCEYNTFIDTVVAEIALFKSTQDNTWYYAQNSYEEKSREIDFSPMNGTWNAIYYHASNYLTQDRIPYTFTFSQAQTISVKSNSFPTSTITVLHELNDIWTEYLNPNFTEGMTGPMRYETGVMEIRIEQGSVAHSQRARSPVFTITFSETENDGFFKTDCVLKITADEIIFSDAHGAKDCILSRN